MKQKSLFYVVAALISVILVTMANENTFMSTAYIIKMGFALLLIILVVVMLVIDLRKKKYNLIPTY